MAEKRIDCSGKLLCLLLALLGCLAWTSVAQAQMRLGRSGPLGSYSTPSSGSIGPGTGAGFGQAGYIFIPTQGFRPAFTEGPVYPRFGHSANPGPRAELDITAPDLTDVWVEGRFIQGWGTERAVPTPVLPEGVDSYVRVRVAYQKGKEARWVKVRPGEKVTVDFSLPDPEPGMRKPASPPSESHP
jgi:uncharacterized protein (TIGR03000 family)